ncbi:tetratricopeptide repeat protein [Methylocystis iwaonis]|uniref:O-linked N-acetylglucosamine transferase, SPINDLY family protein n=1 Tax=Methylocystis iwaonis TaxID=2885079 RepID=UPI002E7C1CB4|nr:tetratricopeptide repeat protein [Methylocystis iwaonis]
MLTPASPLASGIEIFNLAIHRAKRRNLPLVELFDSADKLRRAGQPALASELYKTWIAFNGEHELLHMAYFNYAVGLREQGDISGAAIALRECLRVKPDFAQAHINLGRAFEDAGDIGAAVQQWRALSEKLAEVNGETVAHKVLALHQIGRVLEGVEDLQGAEEALKQALELRPDKTEAAQHWISLRQRQCKWPAVAAAERLPRRNLIDGMSSMSLAAYADDPMFQLAKAYRYNKSVVGRPAGAPLAPRERKPRAPNARLRIGYVSSDLREHAVGFALVEVLEGHDKARFEIFAYYCGEDRPADETQSRIKAAVDHWIDIKPMDDAQAAMRIADDEIDILVDLNGYTKHARTRIFAYRPAPVIVNWCGYPGTMGSPYHHYMIADPVIVPEENKIFYSEKVLWIGCNQPLDRKRRIAERRPTREEAGLPNDAFVFACLNGMQKITANTFALWMSILKATPNSVLWLLTGGADVNERLRKAAADHGVAPERILFAEKAANPNHLARIPLADLFLDTLPYGAHSTAADALTMGLPVLTLRGRSFAARFCASVVTAAGLDDFICATPEEFFARATEFARNPAGLAARRQALVENRDRSALRDIEGTVRRLESVFAEMHEDFVEGRTPTPDLTNLDVYYEIGCELDLESLETLGEDAYRALYRDKLKEWSEHMPIPQDRRLADF